MQYNKLHNIYIQKERSHGQEIFFTTFQLWTKTICLHLDTNIWHYNLLKEAPVWLPQFRNFQAQQVAQKMSPNKQKELDSYAIPLQHILYACLLQMAISPLFQLRIANRLLHWISNFLSLKINQKNS